LGLFLVSMKVLLKSCSVLIEEVMVVNSSMGCSCGIMICWNVV